MTEALHGQIFTLYAMLKTQYWGEIMHELAIFGQIGGSKESLLKSVKAKNLIKTLKFPGLSKLTEDQRFKFRGWFSTTTPDHDNNPALRTIDPAYADTAYIESNGMTMKWEHDAELIFPEIPQAVRQSAKHLLPGADIGTATSLSFYENGIYGEGELYYDVNDAAMPTQARKAIKYAEQGGEPAVKASIQGSYFMAKDSQGKPKLGIKPVYCVLTKTPINTDTAIEMVKSLNTQDGWEAYQRLVLSKSWQPGYETNPDQMEGADALMTESVQSEIVKRVGKKRFDALKAKYGVSKACEMLKSFLIDVPGYIFDDSEIQDLNNFLYELD